MPAKQGSPDDWLELGDSDYPFGRLIKPIDVARLGTHLRVTILELSPARASATRSES